MKMKFVKSNEQIKNKEMVKINKKEGFFTLKIKRELYNIHKNKRKMIKSRGRKQKKKYIKYTKVASANQRKKQNRLRAFFTVCARRCYHDYIEKKGKGGEITYAENQQN